jgi:L-threonylcarbamoyladenylate synthase
VLKSKNAMSVVSVTEAARLLISGQLVGLPTETVYGLAADADNELAVRQIFACKGRPSTHPLIVHVADHAMATRYAASFSQAATMLAQRFWPGPLTLVVKKSDRASDIVTGGQDTVALRMPAHPAALEVLRAVGRGVAAPSANLFGAVSPTCSAHVFDSFGKDFPVIEGGACAVGVESTIVDMTTSVPRVLRSGAVTVSMLQDVLQH